MLVGSFDRSNVTGQAEQWQYKDAYVGPHERDRWTHDDVRIQTEALAVGMTEGRQHFGCSIVSALPNDTNLFALLLASGHSGVKIQCVPPDVEQVSWLGTHHICPTISNVVTFRVL